MAETENSIALLTTDFKPMVGGIAEYLHHLWSDVAHHRPVTVMTAVPLQQSHSCSNSYRLQILPPPPDLGISGNLHTSSLFRHVNNVKNLYNMRQYARTTTSMLKEVCRGDIQVFIGVWDFVSHFWCEELRRQRIPYWLHTYGLELVKPVSPRLMQWREQDVTAAKGVIACSSGTAGLLDGLNTKIQVVTPGIDLTSVQLISELISEQKIAELRKELNLPESNILLTVSRLVPRKGVDRVLRSLSALLVNFPDLHYIVAGDGPELNALIELAKELKVERHVHFMGNVDEPTKWVLYQLADLFVLPNRTMGGTDWEGFGIVFLEAALSGKPSIGGNNGGTSDAIENGVTGLLIDPEDINNLSSSISSLLRDDALRQSMGQAAAIRAKNQFEWNVISTQFRAYHGW